MSLATPPEYEHERQVPSGSQNQGLDQHAPDLHFTEGDSEVQNGGEDKGQGTTSQQFPGPAPETRFSGDQNSEDTLRERIADDRNPSASEVATPCDTTGGTAEGIGDTGEGVIKPLVEGLKGMSRYRYGVRRGLNKIYKSLREPTMARYFTSQTKPRKNLVVSKLLYKPSPSPVPIKKFACSLLLKIIL